MIEIIYVSMIILIISSLFYKEIHKHNKLLYVLAIIVVLLTTNESPNMVNTGIVPVAFFLVTIMSGILDKGEFRKHLFMVRAELAILGSILMFPHTFGYFEYYVEELGVFSLSLSFYIGFIAYLLMLPLFITSFQKIRRKMGYKKWKALHKLSYVFFIAVGLHLILIQNENMPYYIALFGFYFLMKGAMVIQEKRAKTLKLQHVQK